MSIDTEKKEKLRTNIEMREEKTARKERIHEKIPHSPLPTPYSLLPILFFFLFLPVLSAQNADSRDSALARAQEARKRAGDFETNAYFPGEWEDAEGKYVTAGLMANRENAVKTYNEAADAFDRVFELAIPLYAQAREDDIMAVRDYLITLGAKELFSEYLLSADRTALLALTQYEARDYYTARDTAVQAQQKFDILETAFNAWLLKDEIQARGFAGYEPEQFDLGGEKLIDTMDAYTAGDLVGARKKAEEALVAYNLALSNSWVKYAELRASLAEGERLAALDMKTYIAAKEFFNIANFDNETALELLESKKYEDAARLFIDAEVMFVIASITTLEKRRAAAAAIKNANIKIQESDIIVKNAGKNR